MSAVSKTKECAIEARLVKAVALFGGVTVKMQSAPRGFPDRLVLLPGGKVIFTEVKRPKGGRVSPHQRDWMARLRQCGARAVVVRNAADIDKILWARTASSSGDEG